jgi:hypothetical protein
MLADPPSAFTEQNTVATALTGLAGLAKLVRALAVADAAGVAPEPPDDLVYVLLGIAGLGEAVTRLPEPGPAPIASSQAQEPGEWLR